MRCFGAVWEAGRAPATPLQQLECAPYVMDVIEKIYYLRACIGAPPQLPPSQPDDDVPPGLPPPGWSFSKPEDDVPPGVPPPGWSFEHGNHGDSGFPDDASGKFARCGDLAVCGLANGIIMIIEKLQPGGGKPGETSSSGCDGGNGSGAPMYEPR